MVDESDGIEEAFEGQLRVALTAAGQIGERYARAREEALRRAQAQSEQAARELQARIAAERGASRAELAQVYRPEWWDKAEPQDVGRAHQLARAWADSDPEAVRAEQRIKDEVRNRYGVDVDTANGDPAQVQAAVARAEQLQREQQEQRAHAAADAADAQSLMTDAERADQAAERARDAAEHEPDPAERGQAAADAATHETTADRLRNDAAPAYDSAERREALASDLKGRGLAEEDVATRLRADVSYGKPATEATRSTSTKAPKARKTRGSREAQVQRSGLDR
ncbi:hypothetical protein [Oerskovia enterophila]|uniref:hypothetical protein n=1 Tax=Oerskovia enterophila TaxID=43678 RepID=UPI003391367F